MRYFRPILRQAAIADPDMPALCGQKALRVAGMDTLTRAGPPQGGATDHAALDRFSQMPGALVGLGWDRPRIMGILNTTPDSFSDGGRFGAVETAISQAFQLVADGADILDIGGESTRPGAETVSTDEEIARTVPLITQLRAAGLKVPISIDTRKARVAEAALHAGASFVNDVSALGWDNDMARVVADARVPVCLMHAQGTPQTMQHSPRYDDVRFDVYDWLSEAIDRALNAGIDRDRIIIDPGIGFGKTLQHNLTLLHDLAIFHQLGCVILLGASRKRFIGTLSGTDAAADRVAGSVAVALHAAGQGAQILRVHDVKETRQALSLWQALSEKPEEAGL